MPLGTKHDESGVMLAERGQIFLQRDDGGRWRLETRKPISHLVGQRVRVKGVRDAFDILAASSIVRD